jgi:hypothetical protein
MAIAHKIVQNREVLMASVTKGCAKELLKIERTDAIHLFPALRHGLLRFARNDGRKRRINYRVFQNATTRWAVEGIRRT